MAYYRTRMNRTHLTDAEIDSVKIEKKDFMAYYRVQMSGVTNMFDMYRVETLAHLSERKVRNIMKHYEKYHNKWIKK